MVKPPNPSFATHRAPTVAERDAKKDFIKHDFDEEEFDIPLFKTTDKKVKRGRNGRIIFRNDGDGVKRVPVYKHVPRTRGMVDQEFLKKHNLSSSSKPHEFVDIYFATTQTKRERIVPNRRSKNDPDTQGDF